MVHMSADHSPAETQLASFLAKYTPEMEARATSILSRMNARLPGAVQMVYDNYNALAIAYGPSEKVSDAIFSIAIYPRWVSLFFSKGAGLSDPDGLLQGTGSTYRHIVISSAEELDKPAIADLMERAIFAEEYPIIASGPGRLVIKSISAKQRSRRPTR